MTAGADEAPWWRGSRAATVHVTVPQVREAAVHRLEQLGVPAQDARTTAGHLLEGDLRGHPSQGVGRLLQITEMLRRGTLDPTATRSTTRTAPGVAVVEGGGGLGPPAATDAIAVARELVAACGVAVVGVRNAGHLGMLAPFAEQAAHEGRFSMVVTASEPAVAVPGGRRPVFGTNPIAYAYPGPDGPIAVDFSTSPISRSALLAAAEDGRELAPGIAVDAAGSPTRDAAGALTGAMLPWAPAHKGALLCLLAAMLAGPVVGGPVATEVTGTRQPAKPPRKADFFLLLDLTASAPGFPFTRTAAEFLGEVAAVGDGTFRAPGSGARRRREEAMQRGVDIDARTADLLWPQGIGG